MQVFRAVRLARLFKLRQFRVIIKTMTKAVSSISYLCGLLCLFLFVAAVLGVQLFAGELDGLKDSVGVDIPKPSSNFDNLYASFLTTFQIITLDAWSSILWACGASRVGHWSFFFFLVLIILGNYMLMNLFVAILLATFGQVASTSSAIHVGLDAQGR